MKGISVVGYIRHNSEKTNTVVYDSPNSTIAEVFPVTPFEDAVSY